MGPAMLTATEIAGFAGAGLAGAAYVPQISHLVRARCSAGISRLAFAVWLLSSLLTTTRAVAIGAGVFIMLGGTQIVATALIIFYAARYKDTLCPVHLPGERAAGAAVAGAGAPGNERGAERPLPNQPVRQAQPGTASLYPIRRPRSEAVTGFHTTRHFIRRAWRRQHEYVNWRCRRCA